LQDSGENSGRSRSQEFDKKDDILQDIYNEKTKGEVIDLESCCLLFNFLLRCP
jgi:hypothetical protein